MDASHKADDWISEVDADNMQFGEYSVSASSTELDGLLVQDNTKDDAEFETLSMADLVQNRKIDLKDEVEDVREFVKNTIEDMRREYVKPFKEAEVAKKLAYESAKDAYDNATEAERLSNPKFEEDLKKAKQEYERKKANIKQSL